MFKSRAVAKVKPSNSCNTVLILGNGKGFPTSLLLSSLKSLIKRTVWFFFGITNEGAAHSDDGCHSNTPSLHSLLISFFIKSFSLIGTGKALP